MKIYRCDRCGHEHHHAKGIVGNEFERHGFETLAPAYRVNGAVDVCGPCFKVMQKALRAANDEAREAVRVGFLRRLLGGAST